LAPLHWTAERINRWLDRRPSGAPAGSLDPELARVVYRRWFRDDVARTEQLLGRDLSAWKRD
jgi:hypothetical protein